MLSSWESMVERDPHAAQWLPPPPEPELVTSCDPLPSTKTRGLSCACAETMNAETVNKRVHKVAFFIPQVSDLASPASNDQSFCPLGTPRAPPGASLPAAVAGSGDFDLSR